MFNVKKSLFCFSFLGMSLISSATDNYKVAFISDVHFHDVYGNFKGDFEGLKSNTTGKFATIRTMGSQMSSTRLFNENYFAFIAVLDDLANRGIKYIALPGDFSDDGQEVHIAGLKKIMDDYSKKYDMQFFMTFGNHDPSLPFTAEEGKANYLGKNGKEQPIFSKNASFKVKEDSNPVIYSEVVKEQGYADIINQIQDYGLVPKESYIYWETPFSKYNVSNYSFNKAKTAGELNNRTYKISYEGSGDTLGKETFEIIDGSYLVEPIEGLWLLAIDANVYVPVKDATSDKEDPNNFTPASNAGYNKVLTHKKHIVEWVENVAKEAKKNGKTLVTFSHYPMIDFYNGASTEAEGFFGNGKFELKRVPIDEVSETFANAGIKLHFGGHMHFNDTAVKVNNNGNFLVNIQVPSIAAYKPAYKILSLNTKENTAEIETVVIDEVPRFNELFEHYAKEHAELEKSGAKNIWKKEILDSKSYKEFAHWHIKELVRLRFLVRDWPKEVTETLIPMNGKEMLIFTTSESESDLKNKLKKQNIDIEDLSTWDGNTLATDFYRFRNAADLALDDVPRERLNQYQAMYEIILENPNNSIHKEKLMSILSMLNKFANDHPSRNFTINLNTGDLKEIN